MSGKASRVIGFVGLMGAAMLAVPGCATDARDDGAPASEDELGYRVGANMVATDKSTLRLLEGYNSLLDEGYSSCVVPVRSDSGPPVSVGNVAERFEIRYVDSRVELANELGIDLGLGVKYGPINIGFSFGFLNSYRKSNTSVTFLVRAVQSYTVANLRGVQLRPEMVELLKNDEDAFVQRCGDGYVNGIVHNAELSVLIRFDANTEETARQIKAEISGGGGATAAGQSGEVDGNLRTRLVNNSRRADVTASVVIGTRGFLASGTPSAGSFVSLGTGITNETFDRIEQLGKAMGKSISEDICRDGGAVPGSCAVAGLGYENNPSRNARPSAVLFAGYNKAQNAPTTTAAFNPYRRIQEKLNTTEDHLRTISVLQTKMENAYYNEIAPFIEASPEERARYNVAPPAAALLRPQQVSSLVETWRAKFAPSDGARIGTVTGRAYELADACWQGVKLGDYAGCNPGQRADETETYAFVKNELDRYVASGRCPPPLRQGQLRELRQGELPRPPGDARARLPYSDEVARLAPVVASVPREGKTWFKDDTGRCRDDAYFENPLSGGPASIAQAYKCHRSGGWLAPWTWMSLDAICVPANGPFGSIPNL